MSEEPQHGQQDDLWSWIDQEDPAADVPEVQPSSVTAVMVVTNAATWLPRQLLSLAALQPKPATIVAVDTGSTDDSLELLEQARAEGVLAKVMQVEGRPGFGGAVAAALEGQEPEWLWLLHDDSAPHPDALAALLDGARHAEVVVPKLLQPRRRNYPETLAEIGQSITRGGLRVPLVEVGDIDQGQSVSAEVLGGSTAGLLIKGEVWRELGGLAPEIERHRDGVEFCWRVNSSGFRVLTWPDAALNHLEAGRIGLRPSDEHPHLDDRLAALRLAAARGASYGPLAVASVLRSLGFLVGKSPGHATAELKALSRLAGSKSEVAALAARQVDEDLTPVELLPKRLWPLRQAFDRLGAGITERYRGLADSGPTTSIDELTGDDYAGTTSAARALSPVAVVLVVMAVAAFFAGRTLLGLGPVAGGGLLPAPATLAAAWNAYLTGEAPWLGLAAVASLAGLGFPAWFSFIALLATPLLAALAMLSLLRGLRVPATSAAAISATWAGGVILLGLVTTGDIAGMSLAVVGPLLAKSVLKIHGSTAGGPEALRQPAVAGFLLLVAAVMWPVALPLATLAVAAALVRQRHRWPEACVVLLPAWAVIAPWVPELVRNPGRLLTGTDPLAWPEYPPASYALLIGRILPSGLPLFVNIAFFAVVAVVAAAAIGRLSLRRLVVAVALVGIPLLTGTLLSRLTVPLDGGVGRPLLSAWALLALASMLAPIAWQARNEQRVERTSAIALGVVAALAAGTWAVVGFAGPVESRTSSLPGYVRDVVSSQRDSRVLMIDLREGGAVAWNIVDARQPRWGSGERNLAGSFSDQFAAIATTLATDSPPADLAQRFRLMGVSHLWIRGFSSEQRSAIDNLEDFQSAPTGDGAMVWTVGGRSSRTFMIGADGSYEPILDSRVPEGAENRTVWLAEEPGADWTLRLNGQELVAESGKPLEGQALELAAYPVAASGGVLEAAPATHGWRAGWHLLILAVLLVLAAPSLNGSGDAKRGSA